MIFSVAWRLLYSTYLVPVGKSGKMIKDKSTQYEFSQNKRYIIIAWFSWDKYQARWTEFLLSLSPALIMFSVQFLPKAFTAEDDDDDDSGSSITSEEDIDICTFKAPFNMANFTLAFGCGIADSDYNFELVDFGRVLSKFWSVGTTSNLVCRLHPNRASKLAAGVDLPSWTYVTTIPSGLKDVAFWQGRLFPRSRRLKDDASRSASFSDYWKSMLKGWYKTGTTGEARDMYQFVDIVIHTKHLDYTPSKLFKIYMWGGYVAAHQPLHDSDSVVSFYNFFPTVDTTCTGGYLPLTLTNISGFTIPADSLLKISGDEEWLSSISDRKLAIVCNSDYCYTLFNPHCLAPVYLAKDLPPGGVLSFYLVEFIQRPVLPAWDVIKDYPNRLPIKK